MRTIRSFPEIIPAGRAYVQDDTERFLMSGYDYAGLKRFTEDIILLEWDIAVSSADLERFTAHAELFHDWPMVAPYDIGQPPHCAHWRDPGGNRALRPIARREPDCDLFGFGMVYLPAWVIRDCPARYQNSSVMGDGTLPRWLREQPGWEPVPVDWSIRVVHLR